MKKNFSDFISEVITRVSVDERLEAVILTGSLATKYNDEFSDIDLMIYVRDQVYDQFMENIYSFANQFDGLMCAFTGEHVNEKRLLICIYGPELMHVDFKFVSSSSDNWNSSKEYQVLWVKNPLIKRLIEEKSSLKKHSIISLDWYDARFLTWLHNAVSKYKRGELFECINMLNTIRCNILGPMIHRIHNKDPRGVRHIEIYPEDIYQGLLRKTVCNYSLASINGAIHATLDIYLLILKYQCPNNFQHVHSTSGKIMKMLEN